MNCGWDPDEPSGDSETARRCLPQKESKMFLFCRSWDLIFLLILDSSSLTKPVVPAELLASLQSPSLTPSRGIKCWR